MFPTKDKNSISHLFSFRLRDERKRQINFSWMLSRPCLSFLADGDGNENENVIMAM